MKYGYSKFIRIQNVSMLLNLIVFMYKHQMDEEEMEKKKFTHLFYLYESGCVS